jgi:hypothetical protein
LVDAIRDTLRHHGWIEGKNAKLEYRFGPERLADETSWAKRGKPIR